MMANEQIRLAAEADLAALAALYHEFHEFQVRGLPAYLQTLGEWSSFDTAELLKVLRGILTDNDAAVSNQFSPL